MSDQHPEPPPEEPYQPPAPLSFHGLKSRKFSRAASLASSKRVRRTCLRWRHRRMAVGLSPAPTSTGGATGPSWSRRRDRGLMSPVEQLSGRVTRAARPQALHIHVDRQPDGLSPALVRASCGEASRLSCSAAAARMDEERHPGRNAEQACANSACMQKAPPKRGLFLNMRSL
jgi:hypothetical protein